MLVLYVAGILALNFKPSPLVFTVGSAAELFASGIMGGEVLYRLVEFGASKDILVDAHPHIGSDKLPTVVETPSSSSSLMFRIAGGMLSMKCNLRSK